MKSIAMYNSALTNPFYIYMQGKIYWQIIKFSTILVWLIVLLSYNYKYKLNYNCPKCVNGTLYIFIAINVGTTYNNN